MERVVDDVLGQVEVGVEDRLAGRPPGLDPVRGGDGLPPGGVLPQAVEVFVVEQPRGRAADREPEEGDPPGEEPHAVNLVVVRIPSAA